MATLRQSIRARIDALTAQIADIRATAAAAIEPLQTKIQNEEARLVRFAPWLEEEVSLVKTKMGTLLDSYAQP